jgi:hypothetical protein
MRLSLVRATTFVILLFVVSTSYGYGLREFLGCGHDRCGGDACGCSCDPGCGCEMGCGCEVSCGCGGGCVDGRQFAGQTWNCCHECGPPICPCVESEGYCCEIDCDCEPVCGCEPSCGCGPAHGCGHACGCGGSGAGRPGVCASHLCFGSWIGCVLDCLCKPCGCSGCGGELYWSEWHNDPPRCCDPCDRHGNWIGPQYGGYRAPYDHPYAPNAVGAVYAKKPKVSSTNLARAKTRVLSSAQVARQPRSMRAGTLQR